MKRSRCSLWIILLLLASNGHAQSKQADAPQQPSNERLAHLEALLGLKAEGSAGEQLDSEQRREAQAALKRLVELAQKTSPALATAAARRELRLAQAEVSERAFQPSASLFGSGSRQKSSTDRDEGGDTSLDRDSLDAGARLRWNLFRGGADLANLEAGRLREDQAQLLYSEAEARLRFQVEEAAIQLNLAAMRRLLAEQALANALTLKELSSRKADAGLVGRIDVLQASMRESEAKAEGAASQIAFDQAQSNLLSLFPASHQSDSQVRSLIEALSRIALIPPDEIAKGSGGLWEGARPERANFLLERFELERGVAEKDLQSDRRALYAPQLDLVSEWRQSWSEFHQGSESAGLEDRSRERSFALGLELTVPLWAPERRSELRIAAESKSLADVALEEARVRQSQAQRSLDSRLRELYASRAIYRQAYADALQLYDARMKLYRSGSADIFTVTDAEIQQLSALRSWFENQANIQLAWLEIEALRHGLERNATLSQSGL